MEPSEREHITSNKNRLVNTLRYNRALVSYLEEKRHLGASEIEEIDAEYKNHGNSKAVWELLSILVTKSGSYASLLNAAKEVNQTGAVKILEELYQGPSKEENKVVRDKKYWQVPHDLQDFLKSECNHMYCIICTLDCEITCDKIKENVNSPQIHEWNDFVRIISASENPGDNAVYVAKDCSIKQLKQMNKLLRDKMLHNKKVLVTSENAENINTVVFERLPSWKNKVIVIYDNMAWDDLDFFHQDVIIKKLEEKFGKEFEEEEELFKGQILVDLIHGNEVKLFKKSFPEELSYYVERTVSTRKYISSKIFEQNLPDIFLFTGIDRYQLSKLAKSKVTYTSSNQLQHPERTVKFMTMDQSHHFEKIAEKYPNNPIHLICYNSGKLQWTDSKGNLNTLQRYVDLLQDELHEEDFVSTISSKSNQAVIISDSPGMGKSVLLAKIGRRLENKHPERHVFFIVLSEFIRNFKGMESGEMITTIKNTLANMLCENMVGKAVIRHKLDSEEISVELLLDGLDEVDSAHLNLAYSILQKITSIKSVRFWVTSRPHLLEKMEIKLNVFGHNINPFDENNQVKFLTSYWSRDKPLNQIKLETFARECLKNLKTKMDSKDHDIAGIPLQCFLLGYIFEEEAIANDNENSDQASLQPIMITNITDLYKLLIAKKLEKYFTYYGTENSPQRKQILVGMHVKFSIELIFPEDCNQIEVLCHAELEEMLKIGIVESSSTNGSIRFLHRTFAEYILAWFTLDKLESEKDWNDTITNLLFERVLRCEIVSKKYNAVNSCKSEETIFRFAYPVITYFINALVVNIQEIPPQTTHSMIKKCANPPDTGMKVALACAHGNCTNIVKMLHSTGAFGPQAGKIFCKKCLLLSIDYAELPFVTFVLSHFEQRHEWEQVGAIPAEVLLRAIKRGNFAMVEFLLKEKGLLEIVKDFNKCEEFEESLHVCVEHTRNKSASEIEERAQIVRLLVGINHQLLEEKTSAYGGGETPLLSKNVHVNLRVELVHLGANVFARYADIYTNTGPTIFHEADQFDCNEYHTFLSSLPEETLKSLVQLKDKAGHTPLMSVIAGFDPLPETLALFKIAGAEFNFVDSHSVLNIALRQKRNTETLKTLIKYGSHLIDTNENRQTDTKTANLANLKPDMKWTPTSAHLWTVFICEQEVENVENELNRFKLECAKDGVELDLKNYRDEDGNSLLHYAADLKYAKAMKFLLEKKNLDINFKNNKQQNVLHSWAKGTIRNLRGRLNINDLDKEILKVLIYLIEHGVEVHARDETGQTFLHYYINSLNQYEDPNSYLYGINQCEYRHNTFYGTHLKDLVEYLVGKGHSSLFEISEGVDGRTPLHLLFLSEFLSNKPPDKMLNLLHSSGVNFNEVDNAGNSVLYYAIMKKGTTKGAVSCLIRSGADWKFKDNHDNSVIHLAAQHAYLETFKVFLGLEGLNVNGLNEDNNTPLHLAVQDFNTNRILKKCQLLIHNGADINIRNKDGDTPLSIALKRKLRKVSGLLGSTQDVM